MLGKLIKAGTKDLFRIFLFVVTSSCSVIANGSDATLTYKDSYGVLWKYSLEEDEIIIYGCDYETLSDKMSIPSTIKGKQVTMVAPAAFAYCDNIKEVVVPEGVEYIYNLAFHACHSLESVSLPSSLIYIMDAAFMDCSALSRINLSEGLRYIGENAFWGCSALKGTLRIPDSIYYLGNNAFYYCKKLSELSVPRYLLHDLFSERYGLGTVFNACIGMTNVVVREDGGENIELEALGLGYESYGGALYMGGSLEFCPGGIKELTITKGTWLVDGKKYGQSGSAFGEYSLLENIYVEPGNVDFAEYGGCLYSSELKRFIFCPHGNRLLSGIHSSVTNIEDCAIMYSPVTSVHIPRNLESIGIMNFCGCDELERFTVDSGNKFFSARDGFLCSKDGSFLYSAPRVYSQLRVPNGVRSIGKYAFFASGKIKSIQNPDGLKDIGFEAFGGCPALTEINIPNGVTNIEAAAFFECSDLKKIEIPSSVKIVRTKTFSGCTSLSQVTIQKGVTDLHTGAFEGCVAIESIYIPSTITNIGSGTFGSCVNLKNVSLPKHLKQIVDDRRIFVGCHADLKLNYYSTSDLMYSDISANIAEGCENMGKVAGGKSAKAGTKVTLKATANRGCVFAGWYDDEDLTTPCDSVAVDYRNPSYAYTVGEEDKTFYARFVSVADDTNLGLSVDGVKISSDDESLKSFVAAGATNWTLSVDSYSLPKVAVKGLPTGMKFTANPIYKKGSKTEIEYHANSIYGASTKPGVFKVTVSLTNTSIKKAQVKEFEIVVPNLKDDLIQVEDSYGPFVPGVAYTNTIDAAAGCAVSGLPAGMKWTAKDVLDRNKNVAVFANSFYGAATKPGKYTVYFTKIVDKVKHTATATFIVGGFPVVNVVTVGTGTGKVSGTGAFAANKKVTLKATADTKDDAKKSTKKSVFAGWYEDAALTTPCDSTVTDYRNPNYTYTVGENGKTFYARFVPVEDDKILDLTVSEVNPCVGNCQQRAVSLRGFQSVKLVNEWDPEYREYYDLGVCYYRVTLSKGMPATIWIEGGDASKMSLNVFSDLESDCFTCFDHESTDGDSLQIARLHADDWYKDDPSKVRFYVLVQGDIGSKANLHFSSSYLSIDELNMSSFIAEGETCWQVAVNSLSLPKVTVKGLPAGMKFTDKPVYKKGSKTEIEAPANSIYGTPTKPGVYTVTVKLTNTTVKKAIDKKLTIEVPNFTAANGYFEDGLDNGIGKKYTLSVGISNIDEFLPILSLNTATAKLAVSGLPTGLKYDAASGKITGVATKVGTYTVTLSVTDNGVKYVSTITIEVEALSENLIGTYTGMIGRCNNVGEYDSLMVYGMANVTVTANGKITAKMTLPCGMYSFSAASWDYSEDGVYSALMRTKNGDEFELVIDSERDWKDVAHDSRLCINGYKKFRVALWRNEHAKGGNIESDPVAAEFISKIKALKKVAFKIEGSKSLGYEVREVSSNDRSANLTVTFDSKGGVKYAGNFDGIRVNGSTFLCIDADDYYTICDVVVPVGKTESVYISFGIERDSSGVLAFNVGVARGDLLKDDKVQLWANGSFWATTNIGADEPWESGYYFWWGDTIGYKWENDKWGASDGSDSNFSFSDSNTPTYNKYVSTLLSEGWITADNVLTPEYDAAYVHWGGDWRMPTNQELDDLNSKCDWTWTTMNGVNGYVVRGRGEYASNSIFLPCAGLSSGTALDLSGSYGCYWSSVPGSGYYGSWGLYFNSDSCYVRYDNRFGGFSVRPVQRLTK